MTLLFDARQQGKRVVLRPKREICGTERDMRRVEITISHVPASLVALTARSYCARPLKMHAGSVVVPTPPTGIAFNEHTIELLNATRITPDNGHQRTPLI